MDSTAEQAEPAGEPGSHGAGGADPFGFALFRNAIFAIADEMALTALTDGAHRAA